MLKTVSPLSNAIGALVYKGTWNASANTPTLTSGVGNKGDYYVVSVAGTTNLDGITDWQVNDIALFNGTVWQKIDNTDAVQSVNGQTGVVVLGPNDVGATANTTFILTTGLLSGGGRLNANATVTLTSVPVANVTGAVPDTRTVSASGLLTGGGALSSNVTITLTNVPVANVPGAVPNTVNVIAGAGLIGGGALTGNITLIASGVPAGNVTGLGTMATQNANAVAITGGTAVFTSVASANVSITGGAINAQVTNLTGNTSISATMSNASLLLVPAGYLFANVNSTVVKIPYYAV
jgi:hypothetical protein